MQVATTKVEFLVQMLRRDALTEAARNQDQTALGRTVLPGAVCL
jgi:hypothetical protein